MKEYKVKVYDNRTDWFNFAGERHREDGPAIEWSDGTKFWYLNDRLHREDGPAVEYVNALAGNGDKFWYLNGEPVTVAEFHRLIKSKSCTGKVVEIYGKKYKLTEV
jgi:hypothetical protein